MKKKKNSMNIPKLEKRKLDRREYFLIKMNKRFPTKRGQEQCFLIIIFFYGGNSINYKTRQMFKKKKKTRQMLCCTKASAS